MAFKKEDLAVLDKLELEIKPVAMGFLYSPPDGADRIDIKPKQDLRVCDLPNLVLREKRAVYTNLENTSCIAGAYLLGLAPDIPQAFISGEWGTRLQWTDWPAMIQRLYCNTPKLLPKQINYVGACTIDNLCMRPDVLLIYANPRQTRILLKSMSYRTGKRWVSIRDEVLGCAWILVYPYVSGEMNYYAARGPFGNDELLERGFQVVAIPFDLLPSILQNLQDMPWALPVEANSAEARRKLRLELGLE